MLHLHNEGTPLSDIIVEELKTNPMRALDTLAKFCPREMLMAVEDDGSGALPIQINVRLVNADD